MNNNDILRRLRYALDISDVNMSKIFELGGHKIDADGVKSILKMEISLFLKVKFMKSLKEFIKIIFIKFQRNLLNIF